MDIDYEVISKQVESMQLYKSGYAFLTDSNGSVLYHPLLPMGTPIISVDPQLQSIVTELENDTSGNTVFTYNWREKERKVAFCSLLNGMRLAITAPTIEISAVKNQLILQICIAIFLIASLFTTLTILITRRLIRPLKELDVAAKKIAASCFVKFSNTAQFTGLAAMKEKIDCFKIF